MVNMIYLKDRILGFIGFTISGCCLNVYTFEKLININSEITTLITFSQYLFIFIIISIYLHKVSYWDQNSKNDNKFSFKFNKEFILPILSQVISSYIGNLVFQFNLSMPTHIIFRSSSTAMTIFLGWLFWNKQYEIEKIIGSTLIGIGTILFTLDSKEIEENPSIANNEGNNKFKIIGILLLILSTVINSLTSLYKEEIYQNNKKDKDKDKGGKIEWKEVLYYNYLYGLIIYLPFSNQIIKEFGKIQTIISLKLNLIFLLNWITQLMCIIGVNILVFKISALSLTIVLLIRRFLSLILSIYLFNNSISSIGYIGIINILIGTIIYSFGNNIIYSNKVKED